MRKQSINGGRLLALSVTLGLSTLAQATTPVFINEIHYDNDATDSGEAVEIAGPAGTDLNGWKVIPYNGNGGASYTPVCALSGTIPDQGNGFGTVSCAIAGLQNGSPDGVALVNASNGIVQQGNNSDGDPATSEGLFVLANTPVNVGDRVHIVGTVAEPFGMTRWDSLTSVDVCSTGNVIPSPVAVNLPFDTANNDPERWEGMLINLPQTLTVTENYNLARYDEFLLSSGGRLLTPTQVAAPGQVANDVAAQNAQNQLLVDDGSNL